jgi:hypothetical protein
MMDRKMGQVGQGYLFFSGQALTAIVCKNKFRIFMSDIRAQLVEGNTVLALEEAHKKD